MIVSLSYADTVYGRLEKLEGNCATVHVYPDNGTPQVVTIELKDTLDLFLKTPLEAKGQNIMVYNRNSISQVDYTVIERLLFPYKWIFFGGVIFILLVIAVSDKESKLEIIGEYLASATSMIYMITFLSEPPRKIVEYGEISKFDGSSCTIETDTGEKKNYRISSTVFPIYKRDGKILNPSSEGMIYKSCGFYRLYQSFDKDRNIVEATMKCINQKSALHRTILLYIMIASWIYFIVVWLKKNARTQAVETARIKVETARKEQEELKQAEYRSFCEELEFKYWNDYLESPEETTVLLERLKVALQNSGYQNWKKEFYDVVEMQTKEYTRPPKEQRQKAYTDAFSDDLDDIRINFNGIFVTPAQYHILSKNEKAQSLSPDELIVLCRKLAEKMPEFRDFLEGKVVQTTQMLTNANEAYKLFKLTPATLTEARLKQAYRRLVQQYHPDKNKGHEAEEMFQKVQSYHAFLEQELRRKAA